MKLILTNGTKPIDVVKRMVFLAYTACGRAMGMGMLQEMRLNGQSPKEDRVWECAYGSQDYPGGRALMRIPENSVHCDYVFGRMMKWGCSWTDKEVVFTGRTFTPDYQSFCRTYPDDKSLAIAALESLGTTDYTFN